METNERMSVSAVAGAPQTMTRERNAEKCAAMLAEAHRSMTVGEIKQHALMMAAVIVSLDAHIAKMGRQNQAAVHMAETTYAALTSFTLRLGKIGALMHAGRKREAREALKSLLATQYPEFPNLADMEASVPCLADLLPDCFSPKGSKK